MRNELARPSRDLGQARYFAGAITETSALVPTPDESIAKVAKKDFK